MVPWSHYELLGVASDADADAIKSAYRRLTKDTHPDRPTGTNGLFGLITDAYDELRDPAARAADDRKLARGETIAPVPPVQRAQRPSTSAEEARAAAEAKRAHEQAVADRVRERQRQRYEEQRQQDEQKVAARARAAEEERARHPLHLRLLMAAAVSAGFIASYNLEHFVRSSPASHFLPADQGMPFGVAVLLVLRAALLFLIGSFLIQRRNYMVKLKPLAVAGICWTWALVTAAVRPPQILFWLPATVFVAIMGTGVYAKRRRR
jgi:curved DNA-binding protein CbpA